MKKEDTACMIYMPMVVNNIIIFFNFQTGFSSLCSHIYLRTNIILNKKSIQNIRSYKV